MGTSTDRERENTNCANEISLFGLDIMGPDIGNLIFEFSPACLVFGFQKAWTAIGARVLLILGSNLACRHTLIVCFFPAHRCAGRHNKFFPYHHTMNAEKGDIAVVFCAVHVGQLLVGQRDEGAFYPLRSLLLPPLCCCRQWSLRNHTTTVLQQ